MKNLSLAKSYLDKAHTRLKILPLLLGEDDYSDVVREAQEIVELALKGMLRQIGIEPPKWHDVGSLVLEYRARFPDEVSSQAEKLAGISAWLRTLALRASAGRNASFRFTGTLTSFLPVTTQAGNGETKAGKKGFPAKASRKATNTFCLFFRAVEM
jgi:HEPN domain-containing protein